MTKVAHIDDAQARVAETIKARPVVFFMKGSPSRPGHA
jgi:glutaredoxin-related protein